jgi:CheY-like chemotaxis protein
MRLQERQYDVVLSDVNMPVLGGKAMAAEMREREESSGQHQRVIFMSAPMTDTEMKRVLSTGADGYVTKPVQVEAMRQMFRPGTPMLRAIRDGASEELKGESEGMVKLSRSDREKEKGPSA